MPLPFATDQLYATFIDAKPQEADWSDGWPERWDFVAAERLYLSYDEFNDLDLSCTCGERVGVVAGDLHHVVPSEDDGELLIDVASDNECDVVLDLEANQRLLEIRDDDVLVAVIGGGHVEGFDQETLIEGPMMNYRYDIALDRIGDEYDAALALIDLPLCVINYGDGSHYLALSGGGMDLSWEICEAYMRLGYLPPVHFTPERMCKDDNEPNRAIVEAYKRSCAMVIERAEWYAKQAEQAIG